MKWIKRVGIGVVVFLAVVSIGFVAWAQVNRYPAQVHSVDSPNVTSSVVGSQSWLVFTPSAPTGQGFIFYPGGLVDADAYSWVGQALAQRGILTVIVPMPLDLAILNPQAAKDVLVSYPNIRAWAIGGHSLGGTMAGQFLLDDPQEASRFTGLALWGSRLTPNMDLTRLPSMASFNAISIYGTNDGIAPSGITAQQRLVGLPSNTKLIAIMGGNHSMFGDYGLQKGDNALEVPLDVARTQIIEATLLAFAN